MWICEYFEFADQKAVVLWCTKKAAAGWGGVVAGLGGEDARRGQTGGGLEEYSLLVRGQTL